MLIKKTCMIIHTGKPPSFIILDVLHSLQVLLWNLKRIVCIPTVHCLMGYIEEERLGSVVSMDQILSFSCE